jgi:RNA polymerase sigma-70 factor (ECF subfamily)
VTSPADPISTALEQLLARYSGMVRHAARSRRFDESGVDEVFQEVRIRLWRALADGEKIAAAPASYVYRTAVSAALDLIRRRRSRREVPLDQAVPRERPEADAGRLLEDEAALELLERALTGMVETRRVVVRLHLTGYHLTEIASMLDWSQAKTRNLLYRGLTDLRTRLTEMGLAPETRR